MSDIEITGNYEHLFELGTGSYGVVARYKHKRTGIHVAIKAIQKSKSVPQYLTTEINALKELSHPNICQLYQVVDNPHYVYLVMELCPNRNLKEYIRSRGKLTEVYAQKIFRQIVSAVDYILDKGYCHRDIKPHNVVLDSNMGVKLIDFGMAIEVAKVTESGVRVSGTLPYMSPEALKGGKYDLEKADMWSLGVTLYEMLTSKKPFTHHTVSGLKVQIALGIYKTYSYLSTMTYLLIRQLIEKDPTKRISCKDLVDHPWLNPRHINAEAPADRLDKEHLDEQCIKKMSRHFRVKQKEMRDMVAEWKFDHITASYILTLEKMKSGSESTCCFNFASLFRFCVRK